MAKKNDRLVRVSDLEAAQSQLRGETAALGTQLRAEIRELRAEMADMRSQMLAEGERTRHHFDVVSEQMLERIAIIAEAHSANGARIDNHEVRLQRLERE